MTDTTRPEGEPERSRLFVWKIAPIYTVVAALMILRSETTLMLVLWLAVLGMGLRDTYNLVRYYRT